MNFRILSQVIKKNKIPDDVLLMSDSGWECDATHMDGIFYNKEDNIIVFTQTGSEYEGYNGVEGWIRLWTSKVEENINEEIECKPNAQWLEKYEYEMNLFPLKHRNSNRSWEIERELNNILKNGSEANYSVKPFGDVMSAICPLLYDIRDRKECKTSHIGAHVGYVGFSQQGENLELLVFIFDEYRGRGYDEIAIKNLVPEAFENKLKYYDASEQKEIQIIPKNIFVGIRRDDMHYKYLIRKCGFVQMNQEDVIRSVGGAAHSVIWNQQDNIDIYILTREGYKRVVSDWK